MRSTARAAVIPGGVYVLVLCVYRGLFDLLKTL